MLVVVRCPQSRAVEACADADALVGPTTYAGWTPVWAPPHSAPALAVSLLPVVEHLRLAGDDDGVAVSLCARSIWAGRIGAVGGEGQVARAAAAIADLLGRPDRAEVLAEGLADLVRTGADLRGPAAEDAVAARVADALDLPWLLPPGPGRGVVVHGGRRRDAVAAARMLALAAQPSLVGTVPDEPDEPGAKGEGWSVLVPEGGAEGLEAALLAVRTASRRDAVVIALWRGHGDSAGVVVAAHRDAPVATTWNTGWAASGLDRSDELARADAVAAVVAEALAVAPEDVVALRALVRARDRVGDPLAELVRLVGVPVEALAAIDGPEAVHAVGGRHLMLEQVSVPAATRTRRGRAPARGLRLRRVGQRRAVS